MSQIKDFANLTINLSATPPSQASFGVGILMVDTNDVPVDKRYIITDKTSHENDLATDSAALSWTTTLWGQTPNPAIAYIGRWVSAATSYYLVCPDAVTDVADWVAETNTGLFNIDDGTNDEDITTDFTSVTTMVEIAAAITVGYAASTNFTGYVCSIDALGRLIHTGITPGAASDSFIISAPASGTDLSSDAFMGASFGQAGLDIETLGAAANAVLELDNTPFVFAERGATIAQQVAFATSMNAKDKLTLLVVSDTDAKDAAKVTDSGYQINALGYQKVHVEYTEWGSTQNPDASIIGEIIPQTEATINFAMWSLAGVSESGKGADGVTVKTITAGEKIALEAKGYDFLAKPSTVTHFVNGLASGGNEMRVMFGKLYCEAKTDEEIYGYIVANKVVTFSDSDILAIKGIIEFWLNVMVTRKVLEAGYILTMPLAADFTAAQKATHVMDLDDLTDAETQRAVNKVNASLSWSV
ncbi:DUF3383 family protein [Candidatus Pacearchaeota archaeon]|nr:DUF3383 family protein [Candidatus Pacearchaeota archaeon]